MSCGVRPHHQHLPGMRCACLKPSWFQQAVTTVSGQSSGVFAVCVLVCSRIEMHPALVRLNAGDSSMWLRVQVDSLFLRVRPVPFLSPLCFVSGLLLMD